MKAVKELGNQVDGATEFVRSKIDAVFSNSTFTMICKVLVVLYVAFCVQKLPLEYSKLMENMLVRFILLVLIALITLNDPVLGLLLAVAFVLTVQASNRNKLNSMVESSDSKVEHTEPVEHSDDKQDTFVDGNGDDNHPADQTMTDNLNSSSVTDSCNQDYFTSTSQLNDAQDDKVGDQMDQVQTWENQLGPQGMNPPYGFDFNTADSPAEF